MPNLNHYVQSISGGNNLPITYRFALFKKKAAGCQWLTPVILATQEAEVRRMEV
jgi:hypothetical protein